MTITWYMMVPEISTATATDRFFLSSWAFFFAFLPPNSPKNQNFKKWEKHLEISSFYTSVPKNMIIGYTVPEICHVTDIIVIFHFGLFLALFYPANTPKNENLKKWKNYLKISSFYTSVLKDMIICYTVPEIWHVMSVIVILGIFLPFYPPNTPKNENLKKVKNHLKISSFYCLHQKSRLYALFLRYGMWLI